MARSARTVRPGVLFRAFVCALACAGATAARADVALYQATVPLAGPTEADRKAAFGDALRTAAVSASGQRDAGTRPAIASAAADPARYVQQYSTTPDRMLKVGFEPAAMDRLLQQAGLPFWPAERPVTQVLLVVPSVAGGDRAVTAADRVPERAAVDAAALARGLPVAWPVQAVPAGQVRAMVAGSAAPPAGRSVLAGIGNGTTVTWRYFDGGSGTAAEGGPGAGADLAADTLAARYAPPSTRTTSTVPLRIGGVSDVRAYADLLDELASLSLVRAVTVRDVSGGTVGLEVTLRGDLELLGRIAALGGHLAPPPAGTAPPVDFVYAP
ncbi:MAG: DUF2066 domain-containing protein [Steroidobacteraceae bacterium]